MTAKYDFGGAHIGVATFVEQQFGTITINPGASIPADKTSEVRGKLEAIKAQLGAHADDDPAFAAALAEVETALTALEGGFIVTTS